MSGKRFQIASSSHNPKISPVQWEQECPQSYSVQIRRTVSEGSFFFQRNHLSFQEGALCTTPQRLMKSLELVLLGEDRESNRNMSYPVLIATLITSVKMNGGIAVALSICRSYRSIHLEGYPAGETRFCSSLMWFVPPHTLWKNTHGGYVSRQQSAHLYSSHIFLPGSDFLIHFQAHVPQKPMNLWTGDSQEWGDYLE